MAAVRQPCVAGRFYPAEPDVLSRSVDAFLDAQEAWNLAAKAVVAPHAGYVFSGAVAGSAFATIRHRRADVRRVVLLGPAHCLPVRGIAAPRAEAMATPLGVVPIDREAVATALDEPDVVTLDQAFDGEHCLEVELPFLQRAFDDVAIVPMLVGQASGATVEAVLQRLWGGPETLIVVSSDLSHFHDYETARRIDGDTTRTVETLHYERLTGDMACGYKPLSGLLRRAAATDMRVTTLDQCNSGDTPYGDRDRVVGYAAYALEDSATARLPEPLREILREQARAAIAHGLAEGGARPPALDPEAFPRPLRALRRCFVTLSMQVDGKLRGCVGSLTPDEPLIVEVVSNACRAAFGDPRFAALRPEEFAQLDIGISILSHPRPIPAADEAALLGALRPGIDGLILQQGERRALFLPSVWQSLPEPEAFVRHLKAKAGWPSDHWSPDMQAYRFVAESF